MFFGNFSENIHRNHSFNIKSKNKIFHNRAECDIAPKKLIYTNWITKIFFSLCKWPMLCFHSKNARFVHSIYFHNVHPEIVLISKSNEIIWTKLLSVNNFLLLVDIYQFDEHKFKLTAIIKAHNLDENSHFYSIWE